MEEAKSTKNQLLLILKKKGKMSIADLSRELGITPMGVRQHLSSLERDGLVTTRIMRQPMGRPVYVYSLTKNADDLFPKKYEALLLALIDNIIYLDGEEKLEQILKTKTMRWADIYKPRFSDLNFPERVEELHRLLTEMGYLIEVKKISDHTYSLDNYNCIYNSVAKKYPLLCRWETEVFQSLLDAKVDRISDLASGGLNCSFLITDNNANNTLKTP